MEDSRRNVAMVDGRWYRVEIRELLSITTLVANMNNEDFKVTRLQGCKDNMLYGYLDTYYILHTPGN